MKTKYLTTNKTDNPNRLFDAFVHAFNGMLYFVITERNARIHVAAAIGVILAGIWLQISPTDWCLILFCIGWVIMAELLNSSIEHLCNILQPNQDIRIKRIKDMSAGAVLFVTIISVICGLIIFLPYILSL